MKLNSHTKQQLVGLAVLILIFAMTIMYSKEIFEFTFITRPDKVGSLNSSQTDGENNGVVSDTENGTVETDSPAPDQTEAPTEQTSPPETNAPDNNTPETT
ncbi:MAG: hypothetical protein E7574_00385 [Ruminococcaceae bacterium]|nr:hypothetical protein [Oscillospiraceae bacterium]